MVAAVVRPIRFLPCEGDEDNGKIITMLKGQSCPLLWIIQRGTREILELNVKMPTIVDDLKKIIQSLNKEPYEVLLETQGRQVTLTLLVGTNPEEWRRCRYRATATVSVDDSFCSGLRTYTLQKRD